MENGGAAALALGKTLSGPLATARGDRLSAPPLQAVLGQAFPYGGAAGLMRSFARAPLRHSSTGRARLRWKWRLGRASDKRTKQRRGHEGKVDVLGMNTQMLRAWLKHRDRRSRGRRRCARMGKGKRKAMWETK